MLTGIVALTVWTTTLDGPIKAPVTVEGAVFDLFQDRVEDDLPLGDWPCTGQQSGPKLVCSDTVALLTSHPLEGYSLGPIYRAEGPILAGGPRSPKRGVLVYETDGVLRYTTSDKTAKRVTKDASGLKLFFGHAEP